VGVRQVAVTGVGAVTALGGDVGALASGLVDGRCGVGPLTRFAHGGRCHVAAEVREMPPAAAWVGALPPATARRLSRPDRLALAAVEQAIRQAGLEPSLRTTAGVFVGATVGGMGESEEAYRRRRSGEDPRWRLSRLLSMPLSTSAGAIAHVFAAHGPRATYSTACSSSALAIAEAATAIASGRLESALAVGTDALCRITYAGFDALQALDPDGCRPFDRARGGLSLGEGAGALVLEDAERARARGARILARVLGHATTSDAHHVTAPDPEGQGALRALQGALAAAGLPPEAVDYVNAHGTGTRQNDDVEVRVLRAVFGTRLGRVPVSSSKAQLGHCLGAAGAIEAVVTVLALETSLVPPTATLRDPDPAWSDLDLVPGTGRRAALGVALTSSYGFGGHNVTLVLGRDR
jgi:3-oxoacyl-[acyl-carrier-protein] synthase II